jgi:transporter family-2 protein
VPSWAYLDAAVGVLFVLLSNLVTPRLPAFAMTVLLVLGQLAAGLAIDGLTGSSLSIGKVAGCILILASLVVNGKPRSTNLQQTSAPAHNT